MNKFSLQPPDSVSTDGLLISTGNYQAPVIEVFNPSQLIQSADNIMNESNSGYYS